jgi:hypothetical protein
MKINQVIVENVLTAVLNQGGAGVTLSAANTGQAGSVTEIKRALQKHKIVTGKSQDAAGNLVFQTADMGWSGPLDDTWTPALDVAIKLWKTSINIQEDKTALNASMSELRPIDLKYLIATKLFDSNAGSNAGLLFKNNAGTQPVENLPGFLTGQAVNFNYIVDTPPSEITNIRDMLEAIGFNGWNVIFTELLNKKQMEPNSQQRRSLYQEYFTQLSVMQDQAPEIWLTTTWRQKIVGRIGATATSTGRTATTATLANGSEMSFIPPQSGTAAGMYTHFKELANGLLQKFKQEDAEEQAQSDAPLQNAEPTMPEREMTTWARQMHDALEFNLIAYLPYGRDANADEDSVKNLMARVRSAGDWDKLEQVYATTFNGEDLSAELVDSLDDQQYTAFVVTNLLRVRRIQPLLLHSAINWPEGDRDYPVEVNGVTYKLSRELEQGQVVVYKGSTAIKDVIVIDDVLKSAIEATGATIPNINIEATAENKELAGAILATVLNDKVPEMVAFYTNQAPFDKSAAGALGPRRLIGIYNEMSIQVANGFPDPSTAEWGYREILKDREWLLGDGTEANPGAANIHFDSRYRDESSESSGFGSSDDDVETTDEENDLIARLVSPDTRPAALAELAALPVSQLETQWDRIYGAYKQAHGNYLDEEMTDEENLYSGILGDTTDIPEGFNAIISKIGPAQAAPQLMAKLFLASQSDEWFGFFGMGTDDDKIQALVDQIQNITDYDSVNERYKSLPDAKGENLIEAVDGEQTTVWGEGSYVEQLKAAIGAAGADISRLGLTASVERVMRLMQTEATSENIKDLIRLINNENFETIDQVESVLELLSDIVASQTAVTDEQKTAFLEVVEDLGEQGQDIDEDWFDDFSTWKSNNSNQWFN